MNAAQAGATDADPIQTVGRDGALPAPSLERYALPLALMVAETSYLPHPDVVSAFGGAIFPTVRARKGNARNSIVREGDTEVGMFDDNTTPRWALMWAHGFLSTGHHQGWTFAHVWTAADELTAYTHLANLVMLPEPLASLTDKTGPLTGFLRWHSLKAYGWKPNGANEPTKPEGYDGIKWRYLGKAEDPKSLIRKQFERLRNKRLTLLRPIMEMRKML